MAGERHVRVHQVAPGVPDRVRTISTPIVHDIPGGLARGQIMRTVEPPGSPARYETRVGDNHHHVVCRSCRAIADVDRVAGEPPCVSPSDASGFAIDEAEVTFAGICPICQTTSKPREKESAT
jgi:Fur family transcriptional regulator, stress-responsive regulator